MPSPMQIAPPPPPPAKPPAKASKPSTAPAKENKRREDALPFDDALKQATKPGTSSQQQRAKSAEKSDAARPARSAKSSKGMKKPSSKPEQPQGQSNVDAAATATQQPETEQQVDVTGESDESDSSDSQASSEEGGDATATAPDANVAALQSAAVGASQQQVSAQPAPEAKPEQRSTQAKTASPASIGQPVAREVKPQAAKPGATDLTSNQFAKPQPTQGEVGAKPQDEPRLSTQQQPAAPEVEQRQQDAQQSLPQTGAAVETAPDRPVPKPTTDAATQQPPPAELTNPAIPRPQPFLTARADAQPPIIDTSVQRQTGSSASKQGDSAEQSQLPDVPFQLDDLWEMDRAPLREDKPAASSGDLTSLLPSDAAKPATAAPAHVPPSAPQPPAPAPPPEQQFSIDNHAKIVTAVRSSLLPNGGTMQIRLDPPELGALQISINLRDGVMSASFETSNDQATRLLSHSLNQLKTVLESQGVSVDKLHVQQSPRNEHTSNPNSDEQRQQQGQAADSHARREQERRELLRRMWRRLTEGSDPLDMVA